MCVVNDVAVVIPAFNCARVISRAIESVLAQSLRPREIIVVDDASVDGTAERVRKFGSHVRYLRHERNRGAAEARNTGINAASAEWIAFLDADDEWLPGKMACQSKLLSHGERVVLLYGQMQNVLEGGQEADVWPCHVCTEPGDPVSTAYWSCLTELPPTSTVVARRDVLLAAGLFDGRYRTAEDLDLWVRMLVCGTFVGVPSVVAKRHLRGESLTHTSDAAVQYRRWLEVLSGRQAEIRAWSGRGIRSGWSCVHASLANVHMRAGCRWRQCLHAARGVVWPNPQRHLAAKLLAEGLLGAMVYACIARGGRLLQRLRGSATRGRGRFKRHCVL